jgi:hypothetical protein
MNTCTHKRRSQNADQVEAALFAVVDVVSRGSDLRGELCADISSALLRVEECYAIHNFAARRHDGVYAYKYMDLWVYALIVRCVCCVSEC